jgi:hypothetical protein
MLSRGYEQILVQSPGPVGGGGSGGLWGGRGGDAGGNGGGPYGNEAIWEQLFVCHRPLSESMVGINCHRLMIATATPILDVHACGPKARAAAAGEKTRLSENHATGGGGGTTACKAGDAYVL